MALITTFMWSMLSPYMQNLRGLLTVETLSLFMIVGSLAMESITILNKTTTFKSSTLYVIIYDILFLGMVILGYIYLTDKQFIAMMMIATIPYIPLTKNAGNKYKALVGEKYPRYFVEHVSTRLAILENRMGLMAMGAAGLISLLSPDVKYIVLVFIVLSSVQIVWAVYTYKKYYGIFER